MKHLLFAILVISLTITSTTLSLPRFALMTGAKCASCHVNPTGGQMRTEYGIGYSTDKLPLEALKDSDFTFSPKLNDNISIGGDYRSQFMYDNGLKKTTFQAMTTSIYGTVALSKKITFYFKQDIVNGTYGAFYPGTEVFGLFRILPKNWYIKGGTFLPDYGWKLDDHTTYTRGGDLGNTSLGIQPGLIFQPNYKDIGVEIGGTIENLFLTAGIFNGSGNMLPIDFSTQKAYVAKAEYMGNAESVNYRLGVSGYGFSGMTMGGITTGIGVGNLVLLGEIDWTNNYNPSSKNPNGKSMAAYTEIDFRAIQGIWLIGKFDTFDPTQGRSNDELKRVTLGLELFPYSFIEIRPQYRINIEDPSVSNDQALVQMHIWF